MRSVALRFVLLVTLAACAAPGRSLLPPRSTPPSSRDVLAALSAHADVRPADPSCASATGDPTDVTLGAIEAHLLGQLAEAQRDGDAASLAAACAGSAAPWRCTLEVRVEAEDPWHYGITFALRADGAIDVASIACPGSG